MSKSDALEARIEELGKSSRKAAYLSMVGLLLVVIAFVYGSLELGALNQQIQQRKAELATLNVWKTRLVQANEELAAVAKTSTPTVTTSHQVRAAENAKYAVGVYGFGVPEAQYEQLRTRLAAEGYAISQGSLLLQRPSWLAKASTVLYYADASREKASSIAADLSTITGSNFAVAKGAGLAVVPGQERWTFFVHYVAR
jgi:hypothetical protein